MKPPEWDTRAGRILYLLDRYMAETANKFSQRALSAKIFGGEQYESRLATLKKRWADGATGDELPTYTLKPIQAFFGVPWEWLDTGEGWPSEQVRKQFTEAPASTRRPNSSGPTNLRSVKPHK